MKRRNFIILGTAGIAALSIPTAYYFLGDTEYDPGLAEPRSLSMIWDSQTIYATGSLYRSQVPGEESKRSLVRLLKEALSGVRDEDVLDLEEKIKEDFMTGKTVLVDGWILSLTEARQCALFSTTEPK
jgi:hypothetical protein